MPDTSQVLLKVDEVWIKNRRLSFINWKPGSFAGKDLLFLQSHIYFLARVLTTKRE